MPIYRYTFTGPEPEDFPAPPIGRRLQPGDVIEVAERVEHARLELATEPKKTKAADKASDKE
jgi:hypothetical protein